MKEENRLIANLIANQERLGAQQAGVQILHGAALGIKAVADAMATTIYQDIPEEPKKQIIASLAESLDMLADAALTAEKIYSPPNPDLD